MRKLDILLAIDFASLFAVLTAAATATIPPPIANAVAAAPQAVFNAPIAIATVPAAIAIPPKTPIIRPIVLIFRQFAINATTAPANAATARYSGFTFCTIPLNTDDKAFATLDIFCIPAESTFFSPLSE